MRVECLNDRSVVKLGTLENGQCFSNDDSTIFVVTDMQKPSSYNDACMIIMVIDLVNGSAEWLSEDCYVKPVYAKVVVEW